MICVVALMIGGCGMMSAKSGPTTKPSELAAIQRPTIRINAGAEQPITDSQGVAWLADTFWFRPYVYCFLALLLLPIAIWRKHHDVTMLLASGLAYELAVAFTATRIDYRDSHWMITSTVLAIIVQIARSAAAPRTR